MPSIRSPVQLWCFAIFVIILRMRLCDQRVRGAQSCVRDCTCLQDELAAAWVLATRGARLTSIHLTHACWTGAERGSQAAMR